MRGEILENRADEKGGGNDDDHHHCRRCPNFRDVKSRKVTKLLTWNSYGTSNELRQDSAVYVLPPSEPSAPWFNLICCSQLWSKEVSKKDRYTFLEKRNKHGRNEKRRLLTVRSSVGIAEYIRLFVSIHTI